MKDKLVKLQIPEEQIKIKTSGIDELKGVDLMSKNCRVKYIITVNALKEGWDCPNAYILASLADKSSAVEVEQILGRVLRQPYVVKHKNPLLNMSFVLTASAKFNETLDNIVKGLQESGFSKDDYYAEDNGEEPEITPNEALQGSLFEEKPSPEYESKSDDNFDVKNITFDPNEDVNLDSIQDQNPLVASITKKAKEEGEAFDEKIKDLEIDDTTSIFTDIMKTKPTNYWIDSQFRALAKTIKLPQFFKVVEDDLGSSLFEELNLKEEKLHKNSLLDGFILSKYNTEVDFEDISKEIYAVDFDEKKGMVTAGKVNQRAKQVLVDTILAKPKASQINDMSGLIVKKLGDMTPISHQELKKYVGRVFEHLTNEQIRDVVDNDFIYVKKIKDKIKTLSNQYAKEQFKKLIDSNKIIVKPSFEFSEKITPLKLSTNINKSLYEREANMNGFEQKVIFEVAALENVLFWHRNLEKGKGFALNGFNSNHYPDFIIYTKKGNIILLETKGDVFDNDDSKYKNILGKTWAEKAGSHFKYFMAFDSKKVDNAHTVRTVIEVLKDL
jgi:type III restriction enzyme